jgi:acid stress-induced BolA-like protein IbaG/YrbA
MLEDSIYKAINSRVNCDYLDVTGDGHHFEAIVVSDEFIEKTLLQRHRIIYSALGDMMKVEVHALSMKLYTINEWRELHG